MDIFDGLGDFEIPEEAAEMMREFEAIALEVVEEWMDFEILGWMR